MTFFCKAISRIKKPVHSNYDQQIERPTYLSNFLNEDITVVPNGEKRVVNRQMRQLIDDKDNVFLAPHKPEKPYRVCLKCLKVA